MERTLNWKIECKEPESPPVVEKSPEPPAVMEELPAEGRQPLPPPPFYHPRQYYNWEEDRYSICSTDESDVDMDNIDSGGVTTGTDEREDESSSLRCLNDFTLKLIQLILTFTPFNRFQQIFF